MRVLLINPIIPHRNPVSDLAQRKAEAISAVTTREMDGPPFALNDIAGVIPEHEVEILDMRAVYDRDPGVDLDALVRAALASAKPALVGITCMTAQVNAAKGILAAVKAYDPGILTVLGGIHSTANPYDFINHDLDILVIGIGKATFGMICDEFMKDPASRDFARIPGIAIRAPAASGVMTGVDNRGGFLFTRQVSTFTRQELIAHYDCRGRYPNRRVTDKYDYRVDRGRKTIQYLNTALGCTSKCNFCSLWKSQNGQYYFRAPDDIVEELKTLERYDVIRFCDLHTFGDIGGARSLFEKIIGLGLKNEYVADVRADTVGQHPDVFRLAAQAGLSVVIIGLEATTDERLRGFEKNASIRDTEKAIEILNDCGIKVNGNYIVDCDFGARDFDVMAEFVRNHPIFFSGFTVFTPFPGTAQYERLRSKIINHDYDCYNLANAVLPTRLPLDQFYDRVVELYTIGYEARKKLYGAT